MAFVLITDSLVRLLMLLIVIGRKTGRQFEIPVSFAKLVGVYVALTLKANQWWRNLKKVLAPLSSAVSEWLAPSTSSTRTSAP